MFLWHEAINCIVLLCCLNYVFLIAWFLFLAFAYMFFAVICLCNIHAISFYLTQAWVVLTRQSFLIWYDTGNLILFLEYLESSSLFFFLSSGVIFHYLHFPVMKGNGKGENSAFSEYSGAALCPERVLNAMKQSSAPSPGRGCPLLELQHHFYNLMNSFEAFTSEWMLAPFLPFPVLLVSHQWFPLHFRKMNQVGISNPHSSFQRRSAIPIHVLSESVTPDFLQRAAALCSSSVYTSKIIFPPPKMFFVFPSLSSSLPLSFLSRDPLLCVLVA